MSSAVGMSPEEITIAVTVYNRRQFLRQAIASALNQTVPVRVIVVEDCGPDATLREFVRKEFGSRIEYFRNPRRRGLFDNWNVCLELCQTPWLSILHDDDFLEPTFIGTMLDLAHKAPDCGFYFGQASIVDHHGKFLRDVPLPASDAYHQVDLLSFANANPVLFPGQLLRVDYARLLGGFRATSLFAGDWEMWFKLSAAYGSAQTRQAVAFVRAHGGDERGTRQIERSGKKFGVDNVQRKRNLAILRRMGWHVTFERQPRGWAPLPSRLLLEHAATYSPRLLCYNFRLFLNSEPPHWRYALFQAVVRILGPGFVRLLSRIWNSGPFLRLRRLTGKANA